MDFRDAQELLTYWQDCPPEHLLLRWKFGYKGATQYRVEKTATDERAESFFTRGTRTMPYEAVPEYVRKALESLPDGPGPIEAEG
jgi:hypothetical protein